MPEHLLSEEFYNKFREIVRLKHLTSETIMFIDPGEEFSEDTNCFVSNNFFIISTDKDFLFLSGESQ